ncbi:MAG: hypothetical protein ACI8S6_000936, partial [Myxococcota bacterium]
MELDCFDSRGVVSLQPSRGLWSIASWKLAGAGSSRTVWLLQHDEGRVGEG